MAQNLGSGSGRTPIVPSNGLHASRPRTALAPLSIRWTIGDVHPRGFQSLRLSLLGAWKVFGSSASYTVCVNTLSPDDAARRVGPLPHDVIWQAVSHNDLPAFIRRQIDGGMAEGVAWKLAALRLHPERRELALDNDCILWALPDALRRWLTSDGAFVIAEDVRCAFGQFQNELLEPRNSGIVGLPSAFDYEAALQQTIERRPVFLNSELDEQGLQALTLARQRHCLVVSTQDVSICSPFHPGTRAFGRCGAHFIGLNARHIPWSYFDRAADEWIEEHWAMSRPALERLVQTEADAQNEKGRSIAAPASGTVSGGY